MNCQFCNKPLTEFLFRNICVSCGVPQRVTSKEDFFTVFGLSRRFGLNRIELEKLFYQLSRALHPDRFTIASGETKALSLERMSFINQAYSTLKSVENTRPYLLKLEGVPDPLLPDKSKNAIPLELTEAWFELQELILEDPVKAKVKLELFQTELRDFNRDLEKKMSVLENNYDLNPSHPLLEKLEHELQTQSYIKSLERDLERLKKNAYSS